MLLPQRPFKTSKIKHNTIRNNLVKEGEFVTRLINISLTGSISVQVHLDLAGRSGRLI